MYFQFIFLHVLFKWVLHVSLSSTPTTKQFLFFPIKNLIFFYYMEYIFRVAKRWDFP